MNEISEMLEDALKLISLANERKEQQLRTMHSILYGPVPLDDKENTEINTLVETDQPKKKPKHLSSLIEDSDESTLTSKSNQASRTLLEVNHETSLASKSSKSPKNNKKNASAAIVEEPTPKASNGKELESAAASVTQTRSAIELMPPPPPAAVPVNASMSEQSFARPQRAAKKNCVKNLKEPTLNTKLRRPTEDEVRIKLEHEERASQAHEAAAAVKQNSRNNSKLNASTMSAASQESVVVLPAKAASIVSISDQSDLAVNQDVENPANKSGGNSTIELTRKCSVRIKREKLSITNNSSIQQETATLIESTTTLSTTTTTNIQNTTNDTTQTKKGQKKKKVVPKPIKVERLSEVEKSATPIAARTRHGRNSGEQNKNTTTTNTNAAKPTANETVVIDKNERNSKQKSSGAQNGNASNAGTPNNNFTMVLGSAPNDATYCTAAAATFVVDAQQATTNAAAGSDQTFDVLGAAAAVSTSQRSSDQSMATARDTLQPRADSLITEDESDEDGRTPTAAAAAAKPAEHAFHKTTTQPQKFNTLPSLASKKMLTQSNSYNKMPVREIFNPLVPSPVKKKVEAFEHVAAANNKTTRNPRSRLAKNSQQFTPSSTTTAKTSMSSSTTTTTPLIGRPVPNAIAAATNGNFITPNCMSNVGKKLTASASKVMSLSKSNSAGNLKSTASAKAPTAVRANSAEDFRRGLHQMAEERKKEREKKHLLAAQQREAKERERAERMAKAAKEREEKRLMKQQLAQQKERELQEIQRKLKQQEEALAAAAAAEAAAQKEKLLKINHGSSSAKARMPPPQPKSKYTFEMLHEDDSTDEEGKITYKRPAPPQWSLSHVRGPAILAEEHMPTEPIDFLFAVQPRTLDLKALFPTIDSRYLKRNSSVIWQTPPRYSELPKY